MTTEDAQKVPAPLGPLERTVRPVRHGTDCKKVEHLGDGYLHRADDNGPYDVDGLVYCGRCHEWLGTISSGTDDSCTHPNCSCWMKVCGHGAKAKRPNVRGNAHLTAAQEVEDEQE